VLAEVAQTVDQVVIVNHGRLRFAGRLAELGSAGVAVRTNAAEQLRAALARRGHSAVLTGDSSLTVADATGEQIGEVAAQEGIVLSALADVGASLETAFLRLTEEPVPASADLR